MTETTTPLQPTTVEPTKLQPTTPAQPNAPTAPDSPHVTETPSPDHLLTLTDLTRQFVRRGTPFDAVSHVNLTVDAGEFIAIVGRSGNGKSTLINMVAGLIRPTSGTVSVAGRNVADLGDKALSVLRNRTIGFVTQSQTLLGNLTVLDIAPESVDAITAPMKRGRNRRRRRCRPLGRRLSARRGS